MECRRRGRSIPACGSRVRSKMPVAYPEYAPSMSDERPALAGEVQLVGELKDSGFAEQQWLIRRDQRFVQVTELLYRVLEQCDGERTVDEIADRLTETTRWAVKREHVRHMLDAKLIPLGLIAGAAGSANVPPPPASPRSLLSMRWRVTIFGQRALEPIARARNQSVRSTLSPSAPRPSRVDRDATAALDQTRDSR